MTVDDLGRDVEPGRPVRRVVSLVPSLSESISVTAPGLLVGATDWCSHPAGLDVARIGGTKNPRIDDIVELAPDLVVANEEENRAPDIAALTERGIAVWVTAPTTVAEAVASLDRMLRDGCGLDRPQWLDQADAAWREPVEQQTVAVVAPIWRRPWMWLGRDTFAGDVLANLGRSNLLSEHPERYPTIDVHELTERYAPQCVVLPDEPYAFSWDDGPEAFRDLAVPVACVSGRHLTWYGPSLVEARGVLLEQLAAARLPQQRP
jgi:ABC-type Fe3+-hydroxamate transport system substrate-binding protein